jgi:hypothetical protein
LKECEQKYSQYKIKFDSLKSQRLEIERRRRKQELIPQDCQALLTNPEAQIMHEGELIDRSNAQVDQILEMGGAALERLRGQGRTMKVH